MSSIGCHYGARYTPLFACNYPSFDGVANQKSFVLYDSNLGVFSQPPLLISSQFGSERSTRSNRAMSIFRAVDPLIVLRRFTHVSDQQSTDLLIALDLGNPTIRTINVV